MTRIGLITSAAVALLALTGAANAASFRCAGNLTYTEAAICDNPELSRLDSVMAGDYFQKLHHSHGTTRARLQADQITWLGARNGCQANVDCLTQTYAARIQDIEFQY